jgi:hypothetical protein
MRRATAATGVQVSVGDAGHLGLDEATGRAV